MRLERANSTKPVSWLSIAGIVLIPIIIAAGFILATWNTGDRLKTIDAAIVNNDEGAQVDGRTVPIGRQLTSGLVGEKENNVHWTITDSTDAKAGLADGDYAAVLTIPKGFSRAVTSIKDAKSATQTQLDVQVSGVAPAADTLISQSVAGVARTTFNTEMTKTYLDNIYLGFNETGTQMRKLGDAAGELDDGASQLSTGTSAVSEGAAQLSTGMGELGTAGSKLDKGAGDLVKGTGDLAKGTSDLSDGLQEMKKQTKDLPTNTQKLADGAGELSDGVDQYTKSIDTIIKGFAGDGSGADGAGDLGQVVDGAKGIASGLHQYQDGLTKRGDGADRLLRSGSVTGLDSLVSAGMLTSGEANQIRSQICPSGTPDQVCVGIEKAYAAGLLSGTSGALKGAAAGLDQKDPKSGSSLLSGADALAKGLEDGLGTLADGMKDISKNAPKLLEASKGLRKGAAGIADGNQQLADGMGPLSKGIAQVADGSSKLDEGAGKLAKGMGSFSDGLGQYTTGVSKAATGTSDLATGLDTLATGTQKYAEGTTKFADGIKGGADKVPSYTAPDRSTLATVASANIKAPSSDGLTNILQGSTIALLIMLALWIGALATYTVLRPIPSTTLLSTKSSVAVWLRGLVPGLVVGLVQAVVLSVMAMWVMDIDTGQAVDIALLTLFSSLVFMVLNFALVAWFGGVGRFLSVLAVVLAVAGKTVGAVPEFFHALAPILPLTPAMNGFAAITASGSGLGAAVGGLLAWAVIGAVMSLLAIVRARTTKPALALAMA